MPLSIIPGIVNFLAQRSGDVIDLFNNGYYRLRFYWNYLHDRLASLFLFLNVGMLLSLFNYFMQLINLASGMYSSLQTYVYQLAGTVWAIVHVMLPRITTVIYALFDRLVQITMGMFNQIFHLVIVLYFNIVNLAAQLFGQIVLLVTSLFSQLVSLTTSMFGLITVLVYTLFNNLATLATILMGKILILTTTLFTTIVGFFSGFLYQAIGLLAPFAISAVTFFTQHFPSIPYLVGQGVNLLTWLSSIKNTLAALSLPGIAAVLLAFAQNPGAFIQGFIEGSFDKIKKWLIDQILDILELALLRYF